MATGMDTDAMVKSMTADLQYKVDKTYQNRELMQWKQDEYRKIIVKLKEFQEYFDVNSDKYILSPTKFNPISTSSSDTAIVSANASSEARTGSYKVDVKEMAQGASIEGNSISSQFVVSDVSNWNGKKIVFDKGEIDLTACNASNAKELSEFINSKISQNEQLNGKLSVSYVNDGSSEYIKFNNLSDEEISIDSTTVLHDLSTGKIVNANSSTKLTALGYSNVDNIQFIINDKEINIDVTDDTTIGNVISTINEGTGGKVIAQMDDVTGKLVLRTKDTGSSTNLTISGTNIDKLGLSNTSENGKDALVEITSPDGSTVTLTQPKNGFTVNGINYNIKTKGISNITVTADTDKVLEKITKFVDDYNGLVDEITGKLTEKRTRSYTPLTEEQKQEMTDDQIKKWEEKGKQGILRGDDKLESLLRNLRSAFVEPLKESVFNFGIQGDGAIGLDTYREAKQAGKIKIDKNKLKSAINDNPQAVIDFFTKKMDVEVDDNKAYVNSDKFKQEGVFTRFDNLFREYIGNPLLGKDGKYTLSGSMNIYVNKQYDYSYTGFSGKNTLPDQIFKHQQSMKTLEKKLWVKQEQLYKNFARLETAMNEMNAQSNWLMSQMGGM
jgi:flagellar hook-associated protein 2